MVRRSARLRELPKNVTPTPPEVPPYWAPDSEIFPPDSEWLADREADLGITGTHIAVIYIIRVFLASAGGHVLKLGASKAGRLEQRFIRHAKDYDAVSDDGFLTLALARAESEGVEKALHTRFRHLRATGHTHHGCGVKKLTELYHVSAYNELLSALASDGGVSKIWAEPDYKQSRQGIEKWAGEPLEYLKPSPDRYNMDELLAFYC